MTLVQGKPAERGGMVAFSRSISACIRDAAAVANACERPHRPGVPLAEIARIGRAAQLRSLREHRVGRVRELPQVEVLHPDEAGMAGALTAFRLQGKTSFEGKLALARTLLDRYGIPTVAREGPAGGVASASRRPTSRPRRSWTA